MSEKLYQLVEENKAVMMEVRDALTHQTEAMDRHKSVLQGIQEALVGLKTAIFQTTEIGKTQERHKVALANLADRCHERHHEVVKDIDYLKQNQATQNKNAWAIFVAAVSVIGAGLVGYLLK